MLKLTQRYYCNFQMEFQRKQIGISSLQKILLAFGSAAISIYDPRRGDMIACLSEVTGLGAAQYMLEQMSKSAEGQQVLFERPRINSKTVDLIALKSYPNGTLGKAYSNFLETNKVTPDSRKFVQFVDDCDLAYVLQRYRENHDLIHTLLGMPTNMLGEVTVKWVEAIQTHLPMCIGAAIFGPIRLKPKHLKLYKNHYLPWAIQTGIYSKFLMNIYFEKRWNQTIDEIYKEFNIEPMQLIKQ